MQLKIEKDALACPGERARKVDAARERQLVTDFVEGYGLAEPRDESLGGGD